MGVCPSRQDGRERIITCLEVLPLEWLCSQLLRVFLFTCVALLATPKS